MLELTAIADRVLALGGPATLFENVIGSTMLVATPIPVQLSEWLFAGLYGGEGVRLAPCKSVNLKGPSHSWAEKARGRQGFSRSDYGARTIAVQVRDRPSFMTRRWLHGCQ